MPTPTATAISPRAWATAGRSSCCLRRGLGSPAGARWGGSISRPTWGRSRSCLMGGPPLFALPVEFPLPSPEGLNACGRAYADAGMRAVLAPMVAEFSFYEAIPGLLDAMPPALQKEVERLRLWAGGGALSAQRPKR